METLTTIKQNRVWVAVLFSMVLIFSGCTLSGIDKENTSEITEEDLAAASQILGESLSDDNSGVMASLNDAVTTISSDGFVRSSSAKNGGFTTQDGDDDDNSGRGRETNITYNYDSETGTHTLTFKRVVTSPDFSKSVSDTLKYIFTDADGNFIAAPKQQRDRVETIDFKGKREGFVEKLRKTSSFSRHDTFLIDGVSDASTILSIDGIHRGSGSVEGQNDEGTDISGSYELAINFLNIQIDKTVVETNQNLTEGVTGTLSWEMEINKQRGGNSEVKTVSGTIEMNGDGTALLRFRNLTKRFKIFLDNGDVHDQSREFEGKVESVSLDNNTFTLRGDRTIKITEDTEIDLDGDLTTLNQVATALEEGRIVEAEGEGSAEGNVFVARYVEFETDDDDQQTYQYEAFITDAQPDHQLIILQDERRILITQNTIIDDSGDLYSVSGVKEALELGYDVVADGEGYWTDEPEVDIVATEIRFEKSGEPNNKVGFEDITTEVDLEADTVTLENGKVILVTANTDYASDTDYESLGGVKEALESGQAVVTSGEGEETDEPGIDLIATFIRFTNQN